MAVSTMVSTAKKTAHTQNKKQNKNMQFGTFVFVEAQETN